MTWDDTALEGFALELKQAHENTQPHPVADDPNARSAGREKSLGP